MNLVADLNQSHGKGAALFQKRKARSENKDINQHQITLGLVYISLIVIFFSLN